ncbi:MAG TPA: deoxyribose-phosphate aldolase [bacterium]|jgi:deoxyribose-phosphate aldolase|nr:deoxyribose-phosphate aldolase [bacterium]
MQGRKLASIIDHTLLRATATEADIEKLCWEARVHGFGTVCIQPCFVKLAAALLEGTAVKVATVIGFPLGATTSEIKAEEAQQAVENGAQELDLVLNIGALKEKRFEYVLADLKGVIERAGEARVKVIMETCYLTDDEIIKACQLAVAAGAEFVKTSTGFGPAGAKLEQVQLMRQTVGPGIGVKAAGGISCYEDAIAMIKAGANRIGASAGIKIIKGKVKTGCS